MVIHLDVRYRFQAVGQDEAVWFWNAWIVGRHLDTVDDLTDSTHLDMVHCSYVEIHHILLEDSDHHRATEEIGVTRLVTQRESSLVEPVDEHISLVQLMHFEVMMG